MFQRIRKEKDKARSAGTLSNKNSDRPTWKCFRCGSENHMIAKYPNPRPPKDSEKRRKPEKSKEKGNHACNNRDDENDHKIYAYMESNVKKARSADTSSNKNLNCPARKCYRCGFEDHMIAKFPKPPKDSEKRRKSEKSKEKGNRECDNSDDDNDLKVYAPMARMSSDDNRENKYYGGSSQLVNCELSP